MSDLDQEFAADDFEAEAAAVLSAAEEIAETVSVLGWCAAAGVVLAVFAAMGAMVWLGKAVL